MQGPDLTFTTAAPTTQPTVTGSVAGSVTTTGATVSGSVGPGGAATEYRVEYGTSASYGSATAWTAVGSGVTPVPVGVPLSGLTSSTTYHARLVARNAGGTTTGPDLTFTTADLPPTILGSGAGTVTATGATVSATVNPNRVATTYTVQWGTTLAYGSSTAATSAGAGALDVVVNVPLTGLTSTTTYHARVVATSAGGTTYGADVTFTTSDLPPSVSGTSAGSVTTSGATIAGSVNPNRVATTYRVEYGTTVAYGSQTSAVSAGAGSSAVAVSVPLTGLTSSTTYHARVVADSAAGHDLRPGPHLHHRGPPAVGRRHLRRIGHGLRRDDLGERHAQPGRDDLSRRVRDDGGVRVADVGGVGGGGLVGGGRERAAERADVVDDVPRAPGRGQRGRDDERAGPDLHDERRARRR